MLIGVGPIFVKKNGCFDFRERKNRELCKQFLFFRQKIKTKEDVPNQYTISGDHIFTRFYKRDLIIYSAQKYQPPAGYV